MALGDDCDKGDMDMPHASFDYSTTPATLWIVWRRRKGGSFGGCIRGFRFDFIANPKIPPLVPIGAGFSIDNMDREGGNDGQGAIKVRASDGVITVVYQNADIPRVCPDTSTKSVGWSSVVSMNEGQVWTDHEVIEHSENFTWCIVGKSADGGIAEIQKGIGEWDFVLGPDGNEYVAINDDDRHISLFMSPMRGMKTEWRLEEQTCVASALLAGSLEPVVGRASGNEASAFVSLWHPAVHGRGQPARVPSNARPRRQQPTRAAQL